MDQKTIQPPISSLKFSVTAGRSVRDQFVKEIKKYCFNEDLTLQIDENKEFWESEFFIRIKSPNIKKLTRAKKIIEESIKEFSCG